MAIPLSLGLGVLMAVRRDKPTDHVLSTASLVLAALPEFVIGIALVLLFATSVFHVFPAVSLLAPGEHAWQDPNVVVLPAATLVIAVTPYISRIMRGSMVEVLQSEYVTMARLKGMSERNVIWRHAVPNAIVPAIQVAALQLAWMAGGVVVVEFVFHYPGIGSALISAVSERDVPTVQALALLIAGVYVVVNFLADVWTIAADAAAADGGTVSTTGGQPSSRAAAAVAPLRQRQLLTVLRSALRAEPHADRARHRGADRADRAARARDRAAFADRVRRRPTTPGHRATRCSAPTRSAATS